MRNKYITILLYSPWSIGSANWRSRGGSLTTMGPSFGVVNGTFLPGAPYACPSNTTQGFAHKHARHLPHQLRESSLANAACSAGAQLPYSSEEFLCGGRRIGATTLWFIGKRSNRRSSISTSSSIPSNTRGFCRPCSATDSGSLNLWNYLATSQCLGVRRKVELDNPRVRRFDARMASDDGDFLTHGTAFRTRKVVEHLALFKMKDSLTEEQEKDMLDNLWTLQYMIRNVIFTTVGRLVQKTPEGYTHGLVSRFPTREALAEFLESGTRWRVSQDYIYPYYDVSEANDHVRAQRVVSATKVLKKALVQGNIFVDFEADVEDDMEPLFRRGEDFEEGLEQLMLFKLKEGASTDADDKFLKVANALPGKYHDLVQLTAGFNLSSESNKAFSHVVVARLPSEEAYLAFEKALQTDASWSEVMELFDTSKTLVANYLVTPVGKSIM